MCKIRPGQALSKYKIWTRLSRFLLLTFLTTIPSISPAETLPLKHYTTSDGLAHDRVGRVVRDSRGFLWLCTSEGLSRFDGYQFKNYTQENGLPHRTIQDLLETRDGRYWVATSSGLVIFNPHGVSRAWTGNETADEANEKSRMFRVVRAEDQAPGKWNFSVSRLAEDHAGNIWCTTGRGLYVLNRNTGDWTLRRVSKAPWADQKHEFWAIVADNIGAIWVGVNGIHRILPDGNVQTVAFDKGAVSLQKDKRGDIWAGSGGVKPGGLYHFTVNGWELPKLARTYDEKDGLLPHLHNGVVETSDGKIWVGSINGLSESTQRLGDGPLRFRKVINLVVQALAEDVGGNLWIGTESSGVYRLSRSGFKSFDETDGLTALRGLSVANGPDGQVYFVGTDIHRFDGDRFTAVKPLGMVKPSWGWNQFHFQDHAGEWWMAGDYGTGLQRYPKVNRLEELAHTKPRKLYTTKDGLTENMVFRLFEDSRGDIWIGTLEQTANHLSRWERAKDKMHAYTAADGIPNSGPTAFAEDRAGNIWIGLYLGGVLRYRHGRFQVFAEKDGIPPGFVRDILSDSSGRVWVAIASNGVVRIDAPDAEQITPVKISTSEGLSSNQGNCITEDKFGRIYIGTGRGVNRLDPKTGRIKVFTTADGLAENLVHVCEADKSGALWFGFYRGLSRYVPEPDTQSAPPPIFISDFNVNGSAFRKLSELGETAVEDLFLAPEQRQIRIDFFALGFGSGEVLRYQFKFDGSNDWSEPTSQRSVTLSLSPGSYRFLVQAINADGLPSQHPASVSFTILRPVWQRWWFLTLAALLMIGIAYALYRYRVAQLLKVERVRTRIATDLHDDIGASLSRMAILSEVVKQQTAGGNGKQTTGLLTEIADSARGLVDSMGDIVWSIDPRRDDLQSVVRRIRQFASDVLEAKGIDWALHVPAEVESLKLGPDERQHLYLIFKEGINNIARHGEGAKSVSLSIRIEGRQLVGEIVDDGCGFTPQEPAESRSKGLGGNGLPNMRERAAQLRGRLEIASSPGAGTRVLLKIPIK